MADNDAAVELLRRTAATQARVVGARHPATLRTLVGLGEALILVGGTSNIGEAHALFAECEAGQRALLDSEHPDLIKTRSLVATAHV